jgi:hypothetical protein
MLAQDKTSQHPELRQSKVMRNVPDIMLVFGQLGLDRTRAAMDSALISSYSAAPQEHPQQSITRHY